MSGEKINRETAVEDINRWLDARRVKDRKRETFKEQIDVLVDAVMDGLLVVRKEDNHLVHTIEFPAKTEAPIKTLEYKLRITVAELHAAQAAETNVTSNTTFYAYIQALTGVVKQTLLKFDSSDYNICQAVAVFFM